MVPGGGIEPPRYQVPADFESLSRILDLLQMHTFTGTFPNHESELVLSREDL